MLFLKYELLNYSLTFCSLFSAPRFFFDSPLFHVFLECLRVEDAAVVVREDSGAALDLGASCRGALPARSVRDRTNVALH